MDFWPEFLASSWGKELVAGGIGWVAGIVAGYRLDTLRIHQQNPHSGSASALTILRRFVATEGPLALYRGMAAPLASVSFQNAIAFQIYAVLSRACDQKVPSTDPPSYIGVALGGFGTGAIQSLVLCPVELVKIHLQLQSNARNKPDHMGPLSVVRSIIRTEGLRGLYRGLNITAIRDAPAHFFYFWTYEYMREQLHPGCRKNGQEAFKTMLIAGGLAGVASWVCSYPLDVIKTRLQVQSLSTPSPYHGIVDCLCRSVREEGYGVLWRGLGTAVARAFVVNGAIFTAYETVLRLIFTNNNPASIQTENTI